MEKGITLKTKLNLSKLQEFLDNPKNWRPPSYSAIMKFMGWKSKRSVTMALKKLKNENL